MKRRHARRGQSLIEFAFVLPVLLLILFAFMQLLLVLGADGALATVANAAAHQAALAGGETAAVDAEIVSLAQQNRLDPSLVRVQVVTDGGAGTWHAADGHDLAGGSNPYPPLASYNGTVTVHLSYAYPRTLPFVPALSWTLVADASENSQSALEGVSP